MKTDFKAIEKFINENKSNINMALRGLETQGSINSNGDITVSSVINELSGYRLEYFLNENNNSGEDCLKIGFTAGKSDRTLVITSTGKLFLSK